MNGTRYASGKTPEERLAAVVMELINAINERNRHQKRADILDYADLREALRPYVQKEIIHARIEEITIARNDTRNRMIAREASLNRELAMIEGQIVGNSSPPPHGTDPESLGS